MAESIKKFIIKDAHGGTKEIGSFSVVGEVHVDIVPGHGEPYAESDYVDGVLTITIHNIEGNGVSDITTDSREGDEAVNTVTIKTNDNPEGVVLEVRNGSRGNGISSSSEELSPEDGGVNTHTITDTDGNEHVFHTKNGRKGDKGDPGDSAVYDPSSPDTPDFVMANEKGQSTTKAMTQKAVTDAIDAVPEELGLAGYETQNWDGFLLNAYVRDYGSYATLFNQGTSDSKIYYYRVLAGEKWLVRCEGATTSGTVYAEYAIIPSVPVTGATKYYNYAPNSGNTNIPVAITADGYLCISRGSAAPVVCKKWVAKKATEEVQGQIRDNLYAWQSIERTGAVSGHYVNNYGRWAANVQTYYWAVRKGETWRVTGPNTTSYAAWAFFRDVPTTDSNPNQYKPWTATETGVFTATEDGYLATAGTVANLSASKLVAPDFQPLQEYLGYKPFFKKKCIYIGDSISTNNNYYWKGYIKTMHALDYVTSEAGELAPAAGGITLIPPTEEPSSVNTKSIWYRCAAQRMSAFSFDLISLFGGTNDLVNQSLDLGTVDDTPYVDDATGMTGVTDVRPETLTYAAALKGCIEMLRRDFPTTPIVLCTVLACSSTYGGWIYGDTGLTASEAMAELQVKIAELYNLRHVPFYWTVRTREQASRHVYALDGVHPNQMCAQRMRKEFAAALNL